MSVTILERQMYTEAAAARLLRIVPSTLHWWLEGGAPRYRPVIRVELTGPAMSHGRNSSRPVSCGPTGANMTCR